MKTLPKHLPCVQRSDSRSMNGKARLSCSSFDRAAGLCSLAGQKWAQILSPTLPFSLCFRNMFFLHNTKPSMLSRSSSEHHSRNLKQKICPKMQISWSVCSIITIQINAKFVVISCKPSKPHASSWKIWFSSYRHAKQNMREVICFRVKVVNKGVFKKIKKRWPLGRKRTEGAVQHLTCVFLIFWHQ